MELQFVTPYKSITEPLADETFPDFLVVSGLNGSGKTHLLEAIMNGHIVVDGISVARPPVPQPFPPSGMARRGRPYVPSAPPLVKLFRPGELVAASNPSLSAAAVRQTWAHLAEYTQSAALRFANADAPPTPDEVDALLTKALVDQGLISAAQIQRIKSIAGKRLTDMTRTDFENLSHPLAGLLDPFTLSASTVFLAYHERRNRLDFARWRFERRGVGDQPLTDDEFVEHFGQPPWESLNDALAILDIPYAFTVPEGDDDDYTFEAQLRDLEAGHTVKSDELSTGERTLLAIAMTLFGANNMGETLGMPKLLLLDEPDSGLHPSMIRRLLDLLQDVLWSKHQVKVLLTSHSPTTIALAPEPSLLIMRRSSRPRLIHTPSRDIALGALTVGIPTLSIRLENRRQVFVEAKDDADFYQEVYRYIQHDVSVDVSLTFIPVGKGETTGGDTAVTTMVSDLRSAEVRTVFGIIDRDERTNVPEGVCFSPERRTLENFLFDPLIVGYFLLRQRLVEATALGLADSFVYTDIDADNAQQLVDGFFARFVPQQGDDESYVECQYVGGFSLRLPRWYLLAPKNELQTRLRVAFPEINHAGNIRSDVVKLGYFFEPQFLPSEVKMLFERIAAAPAT
ncbi:MAG: ATP-binding protein [Actinomycetota bacterium]|nr:ATP-binding protein [Actinomycetota bacterium]